MDMTKETKLIEAVEKGHLKEVQSLISAGANVNAKDKYGDTVLIWAVWEGHAEIAKALIEAGADVNAKNKASETALIEAAWEGHIDIVMALIEGGAELNIKEDDEDNWTALLAAETAGHTEIVNLLEVYIKKER